MATAELLIYLHDPMPELEQWQVAEHLRTLAGVLTVQLDGEEAHALTLAYDTDRIHPDEILGAVRQYDPQASLPGL